MANGQKKKKKKKNWPFVLIFLLGAALVGYPIFTQWYYRIEAQKVVEHFDKAVGRLDPEEIERRMALAYAYNDALLNGGKVIDDPYRKQKQEEGVAEYARMLEVNELIGHIKIPKLALDLPIYAGTQERVLQKGAGHLESTSLPVGGNNTHAVITAHRGLPSAELFTHIDQLKVGDRFYITNLKETIAYQVDQILIIEPTDFDALRIVPGHDYVTLLTCHPYMINTQRLLVRGHRIDYVEAVYEGELQQGKANFMYKWLFYGTLLILLIVLYYNYRRWRKKKRLEKQLKMREPASSEEMIHETDEKE